MKGHRATWTTVNYPGHGYAARIEWECECGKAGAVLDGVQAATLRRARAAHRRHLAAVNRDTPGRQTDYHSTPETH